MIHSDHNQSSGIHSNFTDENCCKPKQNVHSDNDGHDHGHSHDDSKGQSLLQLFLPALISGILLVIGLLGEHVLEWTWLEGAARFAWYGVAYIPVGFPVLKEAVESIKQGDIFSEFLLMSIATIGAFFIGEYPEGVAVMLFYAVGESFQSMAVSRAKMNIKALLDQRPDQVTLLKEGVLATVPAENARIGDLMQLKPGDKVALDGVLVSETGVFNTAALTGESVPITKYKDEVVFAGSINQNTPTQVRVTTAYADSKLSKILEMVQHATAQKAPTELFIRKFARIYTPIVVCLAVAICVLPYFWVEPYVLKDWLYRSLIFLVISCPCALVISIPLGYFGGIGAASRNGILVKGSNFLDLLAKIDNVVTDKTGTLTEGVFKVQDVVLESWVNRLELLEQVNALEHISTHPVASAIHEYVGTADPTIRLDNIQEVAGMGLQAFVKGKSLIVGNVKLLKANNIVYPFALDDVVYTVLAIGYDGKYAGYITIADKVKKDASEAVQKLHDLGVKVTMLSGDKDNVVQKVATTLRIDQAFGDLLPEGKVQKVQAIKALNQSVAFVGDGVNDAPVVAISDVGIAMGGLGSDATIETADVIIQDDKPSKIPMAIQIGKQTKRIVWQNITLAFVVKAIVLVLGAGGVATMWEAVFADVGVALLAILNAVRIQRMQF